MEVRKHVNSSSTLFIGSMMDLIIYVDAEINISNFKIEETDDINI